MKKYIDWDLLEQLPENWKIDKTVGSPLFQYEFCTNGKSVLNGQKRALVRVTKLKNEIMKMKDLGQLPCVSGNDCKECKNCLYYNVVQLSCKHPNWDNCIKRDKSGIVINYLYHEHHYH